MTRRTHAFIPAALFVALFAADLAAQQRSAKVWPGRQAEVEAFLRSAPFERVEELATGITRPRRGFFAPGAPVASAAFKILRPHPRKAYRDSYKSEIAAYELDKLLGLGMVPPAVEKRWKGHTGAAILWLKPVRQWPEVEGQPKPPQWDRQAIRMHMFDNLIGNIDRNRGNLLVDDEWNLFLIDHSRAFVIETRLVTRMVRIDRELWERMLALDEPTLQAAIGAWVEPVAIRAILQRRDKMRRVIEQMN